MKKIQLFLFLICITSAIHAQTPTLAFAKKIDALSSYTTVRAVDADVNDNVVITGLMDGSGSADFDPGAGTYILPGTGAVQNPFVAKYDSAGNLQWAHAFGPNNSVSNGTGIATDQNGNVFIAGFFSDTVDFDPGPSNFSLIAGTGYSIYVCKYSPAGVFQWAKGIINTTTTQFVDFIRVDVAGSVYLAGTFNATTDFDMGAGVSTLTPVGDNDIFMAKYDNNGNFIYAKSVGSPNTDQASDFKLDAAGNMLLCGLYGMGGTAGTVADFDPNAGTANLTTAFNGAEIFFAKYSSSGNYVFAKSLDGTGSFEYAGGIVSDPSGNIYVNGLFRGTTDFDPDAGTQSYTPVNADGLFCAKYNSLGSFQWVNVFDPTDVSGNNEAADMVYDNSNGAIITAFAMGAGTMDADPGAGTAVLTNTGGTDFIFGMYSTSGAYINAYSVGSSAASEVNNPEQLLAKNSNIYVAGYFYGTNDFDLTGSVSNLTTLVTASEGYFIKYGSPCVSAPAQPGSISGNLSACAGASQTYSVAAVSGATSYTWSLPSGWTGTSTSNSITATVGSSGGTVSVTATNGCGTSAAQTLTVSLDYIPPTPLSISGNISVCEGASETYSVPAVPWATSYTWTLPGAWLGTSTTNSILTTPDGTSGNITVTATNACGTSAAQTLSVTAHPYPTVSFTIPVSAVCIDNAVFPLSGGSPAGGTYDGNGVVFGNFDASNAGLGLHTLTYYYTDSFGCTNGATQQITVNNCTGISNFESQISDLIIYPNPFTNEIHFENINSSVQIQFINVLGELVMQLESTSNFKQQTSNLSPGMYVLRIISGGDTIIRNVIKR